MSAKEINAHNFLTKLSEKENRKLRRASVWSNVAAVAGFALLIALGGVAIWYPDVLTPEGHTTTGPEVIRGMVLVAARLAHIIITAALIGAVISEWDNTVNSDAVAYRKLPYGDVQTLALLAGMMDGYELDKLRERSKSETGVTNGHVLNALERMLPHAHGNLRQRQQAALMVKENDGDQ